MEYITRNKSIITGKQNLEPLYTFKDFPVFFGCVDTPESEDVRADMSWAIDPETGVIQLDKLLPLDVLYQTQHVDGTGPTWQQYYHDLADYIAKQSPKHVLEIGGGQGELGKIFINNTQNTTWTIVEPNPLSLETDRIKIIPAFFDEKFMYDGEADAVVFSQLMEHVYNPRAFINAIAQYLKIGNKLIFAYPNLTVWLSKKYTNALNFEHTMLLTDYFIDFLLVEYGFRVTDKTFYRDHSVLYTAEKCNKPSSIPVFESKYNEYRVLFMDFVQYHTNLVKKLNKDTDAFEGEVYVFGAHIFSQYLFEFGLHKKKIVSLLDNSSLKQGKRLYGTPFQVQSPEILHGKGKVGVVLKVGIYRQEILQQLQEINSQIVIFE